MLTRTALAVAFAALIAVAPLAAAPAHAAQAVPPSTAQPADAVAAAPKVVIVVGATESTTATYRTMADSIAAEAIKWTPNVVKVYSPYATWAVVKAAAQGASIFVYLGHGYGFPNPYTTTLNTSTQDGMGLNTTLGLSDSDKQYYGEAYIASGIRFADNAVVFLNHLCYAPGAGEPGRADPTIAVAQQRVDNFASGFIRAGARAVVADDYTSSVQSAIAAIFSSHQSLLLVWRSMPGYHGNEIPFTPTRNPAFQGIVDPQTWTTGFTRSIVTDANFTTDDVITGAAHPPTNVPPPTLTAPGAASVVTAGLPVDTASDLATPAGPTLAVGTKLRVDSIVPGTPAPDGTTPPPAVQVHTLDGSVSGWVSGSGLAPGDSASPELWAMTGPTTISPNFDGLADRLNLWARLSEAVPWTFTVTDGSGTVLRTQSGSTDLFALSWDTMPGGVPVAAGTYHWAIHAADSWGNPPLDAGGDVTVVEQPIPATAVLAFSSLSGNYTNAATVAFQLTFATAVSGLTAADLAFSGTATGCVIGAPSGGPTTWVVSVSACSPGTVGLVLEPNSVLDATSAPGPAMAAASTRLLIDRTYPIATAPRVGFRMGVALVAGSATMPVGVSWTATDSGGAGLSSYDLARSVDGGSFVVLASALPSPSLATTEVSGHTYRYEARAHDRAGNIGPWVAGPTLYPALVQQTTTAATWLGGWTTWFVTTYSGGSARAAKAAGASVSYAFTGRAIAVVVARDPIYGQVKVYVDGTYITTVDTFAATHQDRSVVYARALTWGSHTIKLVVVGTSGRPWAVVDAFEVIR